MLTAILYLILWIAAWSAFGVSMFLFYCWLSAPTYPRTQMPTKPDEFSGVDPKIKAMLLAERAERKRVAMERLRAMRQE
jgi:hypothetical protein